LLLLALPALFSATGCAAFINGSGTDLDSLHTKEGVRKSLGKPDASGMIDGHAYEDFHSHRKIAEKFFRGEGLMMAWVLTLGFSDLIQVPVELYTASREMIAGHDYRIFYEADGTVKTVFVDGDRHIHGQAFALPYKKSGNEPEQSQPAIGNTSPSASAVNPP
jgi:hypothetical protein